MRVTTADLEVEAAPTVPSISPAQVEANQFGNLATIVDIRGTAELADSGFIAGAIHVPRELLKFLADPTSPSHRPGMHPGVRTIVYGATGAGSALAVRTLRELGYVDVTHLEGGIAAWKRAGLPVAGLKSWHLSRVTDPSNETPTKEQP